MLFYVFASFFVCLRDLVSPWILTLLLGYTYLFKPSMFIATCIIRSYSLLPFLLLLVVIIIAYLLHYYD